MTVDIPSQYQQQVLAAAKNLHVDEQVVAAQIDTESSWNPNAVSSAGAQGIAQFEPATWADYGHGSPFNADDAFTAYTAYMGRLLKDENGNVRNALAAYNAGPGNLQAGYGYADHILSLANQPQSVTAALGEAGGNIAGAVNSATGGLISWPTEIVGFFTSAADDATKTAAFFSAFFQPATYVRIGAGVGGALALLAGVVCLALAAKET